MKRRTASSRICVAIRLCLHSVTEVRFELGAFSRDTVGRSRLRRCPHDLSVRRSGQGITRLWNNGTSGYLGGTDGVLSRELLELAQLLGKLPNVLERRQAIQREDDVINDRGNVDSDVSV